MLLTTDTAIKAAHHALDVVRSDSERAAAYLERNPRVTDQELHYRMHSALLNKEIEQCWRDGGRQVLSINPDLADVLGRADGQIVTEALLALPYRSPFLSFPTPPLVGQDHRSHTTGHLIGAYICGRDSGTSFISTHEPGVSHFLILLIVEVRDATTQAIKDYDLLRITVPITREPTTLDAVVTAARSRGRFNAFDGSYVDGVNTYIEGMLSHALSAALYTCSTTFDADIVPARQTKKHWNTGKRKPPRITRIGWNIGPAITRARREASEPTGHHTGTTRAPHAVRAHFRTVWTGKGRTTPKVAFIAPYMTGVGDLDIPTIHPVR